MSDKYSPRLVHLPGTKLSPEVVLHRTLEKLEHIRAVTIVIQWHNDEFDTEWSQMTVSELCMASIVLEEEMRGVVTGKNEP